MTHDNELEETLRRLSQYYGQMPSDDYDFIDAYLRKTETRKISDEGILEIAAVHSNYRDGDGERFSHARIIEFARDLLSSTRPPPPPSGDAVRLDAAFYQERREREAKALEIGYAQGVRHNEDAVRLAVEVLQMLEYYPDKIMYRVGFKSIKDLRIDARKALSALRALPATPPIRLSRREVEWSALYKIRDELPTGKVFDALNNWLYNNDTRATGDCAALSAPVDTGWMPIETAPRDGTHIWAYWTNENGEFQGKIYWCADVENWHDDYFPFTLSTITDWRPLPAPPVKQKLDGRG